MGVDPGHVLHVVPRGQARLARRRVLLPFLVLYLPWLLQFKRTMFFFYALPLLPFICIALAITIGYLIGPSMGVGQ